MMDDKISRAPIGEIEHNGTVAMGEKPHSIAEPTQEYFRRLAKHYMSALEEIAISDDTGSCQLLACKALGSPPPEDHVHAEPGVVYVDVSGLTGSGKSAVMGEIEIALRSIGLAVEHDADRPQRT